jgi:hypothetical protein
MSTWKRWQDWANVVLGALLFISPFVFGGMVVPAAEWTALVGGVLLVIVGLWNLSSPANRTAEWIEGILGVPVRPRPPAPARVALSCQRPASPGSGRAARPPRPGCSATTVLERVQNDEGAAIAHAAQSANAVGQKHPQRLL